MSVSRELRTALANLNSVSNNTTRRLDDTYYSILEQISSLQSTVSSLQEVARLTNQLHEEFEDEAIDLEAEVKGQTQDLNSFEKQQQRVEELEARVRRGREKVGEFAKRLKAVKGKVEGWEEREGEWQSMMSRRSCLPDDLQFLWMLTQSRSPAHPLRCRLHQRPAIRRPDDLSLLSGCRVASPPRF